jgi:hypothetical protein
MITTWMFDECGARDLGGKLAAVLHWDRQVIYTMHHERRSVDIDQQFANVEALHDVQ